MAFEELSSVISLEGLSYSPYKFIEDEKTILEPRLLELGFTDIFWKMGEADSFGPLSRICNATDADGNRRSFIYG